MRINQLLPKEILETIPPLYSNEDTSTTETIIKVKFFLGNFTWLVTEAAVQDNDILFYGYVLNHSAPDFSEWGYFTLNQLLEVTQLGCGVERDLYFTECKFKDYLV